MTPDEMAARVAGHPRMVALLQAAAAHGPPGAWIGAGFLRNAVWDWLHGREATPDAADLDLVFFAPPLDPAPYLAALDAATAARWELVNQAGLSEAANLVEAIARWPETATAVAVRWNDGVQTMAAHGWCDLLDLRLRPTPAFADRCEVIAARAAGKGWFTRWPRLRWA